MLNLRKMLPLAGNGASASIYVDVWQACQQNPAILTAGTPNAKHGVKLQLQHVSVQ